MTLIIASILILLFNLPFGYWCGNVKKFSLHWFLSIHIPIPFIVLARIFTNLGFQWYTYFFTVTAFVAGQYSGRLIYRNLKEKNSDMVSSIIFVDLFRYFRSVWFVICFYINALFFNIWSIKQVITYRFNICSIFTYAIAIELNLIVNSIDLFKILQCDI